MGARIIRSNLLCTILYNLVSTLFIPRTSRIESRKHPMQITTSDVMKSVLMIINNDVVDGVIVPMFYD